MLDIGCGTGKYLKVLTKKGITILAIDASKELIQINKKTDKFNHVIFYTGDCTDLRFFKGKEIDYITGVNILNILHPEVVESLLTQAAGVANCGLFAFTLPARANIWSNWIPERALYSKDRLDNTYIETSSNNTFLGQMRLLMFVGELCKKRGWGFRIFRFLDKIIMKEEDFRKTLDARYLKNPENSILKLLEFPVRKKMHVKEIPTGSYLVCSVGYELEIFFGREYLSPAGNVFYFDKEAVLDKCRIRSELNSSIRYWNLPFNQLD